MKDSCTALILADLEGIFNVYDLDNIQKCQKYYYDELIVYIDALLQNGITNIYVCDVHNQGNLLNEILSAYENVNLQVISTVASIRFDKRYDFAMLVGFHGMNGSSGILPHTLRFNFQQISIFSDKLKSYIPIGEVEIYIRWLGSKGIPVLLVSGDREAAYEGNCFNPYRETFCVKSLFEANKVSRNLMFQKIYSCVNSALKLDTFACLSEDCDSIYITFIHDDIVEALVKWGYLCKDNHLIFNCCSDLVEGLYPLVNRLIEFDKFTLSINNCFLHELRRVAFSMDKSIFDSSAIGNLLSHYTLYSLDCKTREEIRAYFGF